MLSRNIAQSLVLACCLLLAGCGEQEAAGTQGSATRPLAPTLEPAPAAPSVGLSPTLSLRDQQKLAIGQKIIARQQTSLALYPTPSLSFALPTDSPRKTPVLGIDTNCHEVFRRHDLRSTNCMTVKTDHAYVFVYAGADGRDSRFGRINVYTVTLSLDDLSPTDRYVTPIETGELRIRAVTGNEADLVDAHGNLLRFNLVTREWRIGAPASPSPTP